MKDYVIPVYNFQPSGNKLWIPKLLLCDLSLPEQAGRIDPPRNLPGWHMIIAAQLHGHISRAETINAHHLIEVADIVANPIARNIGGRIHLDNIYADGEEMGAF